MEISCSFCLLEINRQDILLELECKHCFHRDCIVPWIHLGKESCPLCRKVSEIAKEILFSLPSKYKIKPDDEDIQDRISSSPCFKEIEKLSQSGSNRVKRQIDIINLEIDKEIEERGSRQNIYMHKYANFLLRERKYQQFLEEYHKSLPRKVADLIFIPNKYNINVPKLLCVAFFISILAYSLWRDKKIFNQKEISTCLTSAPFAANPTSILM